VSGRAAAMRQESMLEVCEKMRGGNWGVSYVVVRTAGEGSLRSQSVRLRLRFVM
jgi:hypothetical protein